MDADVSECLVPLHARDGSVRAYAIVDAADADWVNQWRWFMKNEGYARRSAPRNGGNQHAIYLHRELLGLVRGDGLQGDHMDRNRLNCKRSNLRIAMHGQNQQNCSSKDGATSIYRGVYWDKDKRKWRAQVSIKNRTENIGRFSDELDAAKAALDARRRLMPYATN